MIGFCGSRCLPPQAGPLAAHLVASVLAGGREVATGCCIGGDQAVIAAAEGREGQLTIFAAFGPDGAGAWGASAVGPVRAAVAAGASVRWWAGGGVDVPLAGRLAQRSATLIRAVAASGLGAGFVGLVADPPPATLWPRSAWRSCGSGSWASLALAAGLGLSVIVFPQGWQWSPPWPGDWVPCAGSWAGGWHWMPPPQPHQATLF